MSFGELPDCFIGHLLVRLNGLIDECSLIQSDIRNKETLETQTKGGLPTMKVKIGEGNRKFAVGDRVYYRFHVGKDAYVNIKTGEPRFPDGYAEVACTIKRIYEGIDPLNLARRYELVVIRRTLDYQKGYTFSDNGNNIFFEKTVGNGRKRAKRPVLNRDDRAVIAGALIQAGNEARDVEFFREAQRLIL